MSNLQENINIIKIEKMKSAKDRLAADYKRSYFIGMVFAFMSPSLLAKYIGLWLSLAFSAYFLMAMIMDWNLYKRTKAIDVDTMPVVEVARMAIENRKRYHLYQMILIPCCLLLLGWMLYTIAPSEPYFALGCGLGAILSLPLGIRAYLKMMSCYKQLTI